MRTARLADHTLSRDRFQVFKDVLNELDVKLVVKEGPHGTNAVRLAGGQISFDPNDRFMTREERLSFDEDGYWSKVVIPFCKEFGFECLPS